MNLVLEREIITNKSTAGKLFIGGGFFCYTLEDVVREISDKPVKDWKIKHETAIPSGIYKVEINLSNRFMRRMPLLKDVPGFFGIRIHYGNTERDTSGCILVGNFRENADMIQGSRAAFERLFEKLDNTEEDIYIQIHNPLGYKV